MVNEADLHGVFCPAVLVREPGSQGRKHSVIEHVKTNRHRPSPPYKPSPWAPLNPPPPPLPALLAPPTEENNGVLLKAFPLRSSPFQTTGFWIHGKSNWVCPKTSPFSLLTNTVLNKPHPLPPPIYWQTSALKKILTFRKPAVLLLFMNGMLMNDVERISNQNN